MWHPEYKTIEGPKRFPFGASGAINLRAPQNRGNQHFRAGKRDVTSAARMEPLLATVSFSYSVSLPRLTMEHALLFELRHSLWRVSEVFTQDLRVMFAKQRGLQF